VIIAALPAGEYGTISVADTANGLGASLPHVRVGLLVGIGTGIPGKSSVLLGDVVGSVITLRFISSIRWFKPTASTIVAFWLS
jgi:hypothetical protein